MLHRLSKLGLAVLRLLRRAWRPSAHSDYPPPIWNCRPLQRRFPDSSSAFKIIPLLILLYLIWLCIVNGTLWPLFPPALYYFVRSARILAWHLFPDEAPQDVHDPMLTRIKKLRAWSAPVALLAILKFFGTKNDVKGQFVEADLTLLAGPWLLIATASVVIAVLIYRAPPEKRREMRAALRRSLRKLGYYVGTLFLAYATLAGFALAYSGPNVNLQGPGWPGIVVVVWPILVFLFVSRRAVHTVLGLVDVHPALPALLTSVLTWECAVLSEILGGPPTIADLLLFGGPVIVSAIAWWEIHQLRRPETERHCGEAHVAHNGEIGVSGRYRLVEVLDEGAMGAVWRAHDKRMGRDVALKQLKPPLSLEAGLRQHLMARMERETQAVGMLKHPGIITIYDQFRDEDGLLWIVMELLRGRSLADVIMDEGRLDEARAARIGAQIAAALAAAHQARIMHRGINPSNILLQDQRVVVTDFGIPAVAGDITLTASGALLGIHAYTAPEQVDDHQLTAACDIWSLGATLYTAVEGRPAFTGATNAALLRAVSQGNPAPTRHAQRLAPVLADLMRLDAHQRPTAQAAATALTAL